MFPFEINPPLSVHGIGINIYGCQPNLEMAIYDIWLAVYPNLHPSLISELGRRTGQNPVPELKLIEFKAETYNGLVRLLRPGCRTIILICDIDSKNALVSKFFKIMWPYRRNKTLNFGFMFIEKVCKKNGL